MSDDEKPMPAPSRPDVEVAFKEVTASRHDEPKGQSDE